MNVGVQLIFQNFNKRVPDHQVFEEETKICLLAEELGFDEVWPVEHHFDDYAFCPDNMQFLSYIAGLTKRIRLGTGAVILPWNDPYRVVEKMVMLDIVSGGRALFGIGRGLSRIEYGKMGVDMSESRERFDEAAEIILRGLETGVLSADGTFWKRQTTPVRPRPIGTFRHRIMSVAMSPDSALQAARLGIGIVMFSQRAPEGSVDSIAKYKQAFAAAHGRPAPTIRFCDFVYCSSDAEDARATSYENCAAYYAQVLQHYELMGDHFAKMKGYTSYGAAAEMMKDIGLEDQTKGYTDAQACGTPNEILRKLEHRKAVLGPTDLTAAFRFSSLTWPQVEASMRLFAKEVLPVVQGWSAEAQTAAA